MAIRLAAADDVFGVLSFSHKMSWVGFEIELCQFLRTCLLTGEGKGRTLC